MVPPPSSLFTQFSTNFFIERNATISNSNNKNYNKLITAIILASGAAAFATTTSSSHQRHNHHQPSSHPLDSKVSPSLIPSPTTESDTDASLKQHLRSLYASWDSVVGFLSRWKSRGVGESTEVPLPTEKLACHLSYTPSSQQQKQTPPESTLSDFSDTLHERDFPVVLVSCGSFNPPTVLHLRMMELARQVLISKNKDVLGGYLSPVNDAYWKKSLAPGRHRVAMCQRAVTSSNFLMVDPWEVEQKQYTRTLHVLQHMKRRLDALFDPESSEHGHIEGCSQSTAMSPRVMLVCGADVVQTMNDPTIWRQDYLEVLLSEHGIVCISRDGAGIEAAALIQQPGTLLHKYKDNIIIVQDPIPNEVSSSLVRHEIEQGHSVRYIVPDGVLSYIYEHGLYGANRAKSSYTKIKEAFQRD